MAEIVTVKLEGLDQALAMFEKVPKEVARKVIRKALRKGGKIILDAERANLQRVTSNPTVSGEEATGFLLKNLQMRNGKMPNGVNGLRLVVGVKRKVFYPRGGKQTSAVKTAALLEYGAKHQPAEPWIRPAFAAKASEAMHAVSNETAAGVDRIAQSLLRK